MFGKICLKGKVQGAIPCEFWVGGVLPGPFSELDLKYVPYSRLAECQFLFQAQGGVLEVNMTGGGSDVFFWVENLHARYFFWVKRSVTYFLGLKKIRVFLWVLPPSELFVWGFRCDQWIRKIYIRGRMKRH